MPEFVEGLFDTEGFPARWMCGAGWDDTPALGWLHITSDLAIFGAYLAIPLVLAWFLRHQKGLPYRSVLWLFVAFISMCGFVHLIEAVIFWEPIYRFSGIVKAGTALVSWGTVVALFPVIPKALSLRDSLQANEDLRAEIAAHRTTAERLTRSEQRYRSLVATTSSIVWVTDAGGDFVEPQDSWQAYTGQPWEEHRGEGWKHMVHPGDRERVETEWRHSVSTGEECTVEGRLWSAAHGRYRNFQARAVPLRDAEGAICEWVGSVSDVHEERESERRSRKIVEASPSGMLVVDRRGRIVFCNRQAERMFGYEHDELIGVSVDELVPDEVRDRHAEYRRSFVEAPEMREMGAGRDLFALRKDGLPFPVEVGLAPIEEKGTEQVLCSVLDISLRKRNEEELLRSNARLDEFAYVVSHDLKAPLRAIHSLCTWLHDDHAGQLDEEGREHLRLLMQRTQRMHALIEGVLAYSRVNRGEPSRTRVDSGEAVRRAVSSLETPEDIHVDIAGDLPVVRYEETQLVQVFQNLIGNAVRHMGRAEGSVHVTCRRAAGQWEFHVRDDGPGIDPRFHDKIFKMFATLQPRDRKEASGVGLAIVKGIVERHRGTVRVRSTPGEGSDFVFTIPMHRARAEAVR